MPAARYSMHFLGVGAATNDGLGCAACVLERDGEPLLLIDCGFDTLPRYRQRYDRLPDAVFITHAHMDHVAGLEALFHGVCFNDVLCGRVRLYVPVGLIPVLHQRVASYPGALAEGGMNFWEALHLIPVGDGFWHRDLFFEVRPARHHAPGTAFSLGVSGLFFYTGDSRPVPEIISHCVSQGEVIFHDCGLEPNPSHTGLEDLAREYSPAQRARFRLYHYRNAEDAAQMREAGYQVLEPGQQVVLPGG